MHDTNFNCYFITSILKSRNLTAYVQDFGQHQYFIDPVADVFKKTLLDLILYAQQNNMRFEVKIVRFMNKSDWFSCNLMATSNNLKI